VCGDLMAFEREAVKQALSAGNEGQRNFSFGLLGSSWPAFFRMKGNVGIESLAGDIGLRDLFSLAVGKGYAGEEDLQALNHYLDPNPPIQERHRLEGQCLQLVQVEICNVYLVDLRP